MLSLALQEFTLQWKEKPRLELLRQLAPSFVLSISQNLRPFSCLLLVGASGLTSPQRMSKAQRDCSLSWLRFLSGEREYTFSLGNGMESGRVFLSQRDNGPHCPAVLHWRCVQQDQPITSQHGPAPPGPVPPLWHCFSLCHCWHLFRSVNVAD